MSDTNPPTSPVTPNSLRTCAAHAKTLARQDMRVVLEAAAAEIERLNAALNFATLEVERLTPPLDGIEASEA